MNEADELLLVQSASTADDPGRWWLPGGGLEFGEDPEAGMLRELAEETGLGGTTQALLGAFSLTYPTSVERPGDPLHIVAIVFRVRPVGTSLRNEVAGSTERCAWIPRTASGDIGLSPLGELGVRLAWPES
jgi:8-oxo-dGTP pyrophosphatase MutT (NUDIX family)